MIKKKMGFIILGAIILIIILANIRNIIAYGNKYSFDHHKKVATEIKVVNPNELWDLVIQQMELARKLEDTTKYSLIAKEVRNGEDDLNDDYHFTMDKPQMKLKIAFPITTYKDNDRSIKFISGQGKILKIYENGQWKDFNGTWDDLYKNKTESR